MLLVNCMVCEQPDEAKKLKEVLAATLPSGFWGHRDEPENGESIISSERGYSIRPPSDEPENGTSKISSERGYTIRPPSDGVAWQQSDATT